MFTTLLTEIRHRWNSLRASADAGYSTETVVATAIMAALALAALAWLTTIVIAKVKSIDLE